jgi:UDP-glucose 4-epimerase
MRKIDSPLLILGGAGFVGCNLIKEMNISQPIVIMDKFTHQDSLLFAKDFSENVEIIKCDINEKNALLNVLEKYKIQEIIHLAANSDIKPSGIANADFHDTLETTLTLYEALKIKRIKTLIFASTSAIYGQVAEPVGEGFHESNGLRPISNYGKCKLISEYVLSLAQINNLIEKLGIIRFPNVVGAYTTHGILYDFFIKRKENPKTLKVLGNGTQTKPYIFANDLVKEMLEFYGRLTQGSESVKYFNISPSTSISVKEIVEIFLKSTNWSVPVSYGIENIGWVGDVPTYSYSANEFTDKLVDSRTAIQKAVETLLSDTRFS